MTTMTIGEVIEVLEKADPELDVYFAFCDLVPGEIDSWRGSYDEASIGFIGLQSTSEIPKVKDVLANLKESISGKWFAGYKGGEYQFTKDTPLHVDNYGRCTNTIINSVKKEDYCVYIKTKHEE